MTLIPQACIKEGRHLGGAEMIPFKIEIDDISDNEGEEEGEPAEAEESGDEVTPPVPQRPLQVPLRLLPN